MPKKSIREMGVFERLRNSLAARTFNAVLITTIILSAAAIAFGFFLYSTAVQREYRFMASSIARTAAGLLEETDIQTYADRVMEEYDKAPEEEVLDQDSATYRARFEGIEDSAYQTARHQLTQMEHSNGDAAVYIAALDEESLRMVYIMDGDDSESYCPPGSWSEITAKELKGYNGTDAIGRVLDYISSSSMRGITGAVTNTAEFGYICTANHEIARAGGYRIMAFADIGMEHVAGLSRTFLWQYSLYMVVISIIICLLLTTILKKRIVRPINEMADAALAYTKDKREGHLTGQYFSELDIRTGDELENLSLTMKDMERDLSGYVRDLTRVTAEKERIYTELNVASQIQEGMIPHIFPAFPEREEFNIFAAMHPAKEVGGDFYDFFLIDEDHLAMVMADVSGKGIPAALFMMASKILIGNVAKLEPGASPGKILTAVNNQICSNNPAEMFVTVWLGILEISTGKLTAANAGHEYPVVRRAGGEFEIYKDKHGFVIGGMAGMAYSEYEIELAPGDAVFQYTDGVTEATNAGGELFGTGRMMEALNYDRERDPEKVLQHVSMAIRSFVGESPQFDDITMLCLDYWGSVGGNQWKKKENVQAEQGEEEER